MKRKWTTWFALLAAVISMHCGRDELDPNGLDLAADPAGPPTYDVCPSGCAYTSIQTAINEAASGATITVGPGTYSETLNFVIDKPLTLLGAGAQVDPIEGGRPGGESKLVSSQPGAWAIVYVKSDDVTISGFELENGYNAIDVAVPSGDSRENLTFSYNWIHTNQLWRGIVLNNNTSQPISNVVIEHNRITATASYGSVPRTALIGLSGSAAYANLTIADNVFSNTAPSGRFLFAGGNPNAYTIDGMTIADNTVLAGTYNIGNIIDGSVIGNTFHANGIIGIAGGQIVANQFVDGAYLALWGSECYCGAAGPFLRPSANVDILSNDFGPGSALYLDEPGVVVSSIDVSGNGFAPPSCSPGPCAVVFGPDAFSAVLEAPANYWGSSSGPEPGFFSGWVETNVDPWITGITYTGGTSFESPGDVLLEAQVGLSEPLTAGVPVVFFVEGVPTVGVYSDADGVTSATWLPPELGTYSVFAFAGLASDPVEVAYVAPRAETTTSYDGAWLDADGDGSTTLNATLASSAAECTTSKTLTFTVDDGTDVVFTGTATTGTDGKASLVWSHSPLLDDAYFVTVSFAGDPTCRPSEAESTLSVAQPGSAALGGGWYKPTLSPTTRASLGFVAKRKCNKFGVCSYGGELVWTHHKHDRVKATSITAVSAPRSVVGLGRCSEVSGLATVWTWDADLEGWVEPTANVPFIATVCDGGTSGKKGKLFEKPDAFGMDLPTLSLLGETEPILLSGGSIQVK
jgi:hypothetical protein